MTFKAYLLDLINGVPHGVYIILLVVFCVGAIIMIGVSGWQKGLGSALGLLLTEYVFLLYASTVIFRKAAKVRECDFTPFWSYSKPELLEENIMNVVVFVPVGLLIGTQITRISLLKGWLAAIAVGAGLSVGIETLQFVFKKGFSEVDDIIHNTLGCAIGYGLLLLIKKARCC